MKFGLTYPQKRQSAPVISLCSSAAKARQLKLTKHSLADWRRINTAESVSILELAALAKRPLFLVERGGRVRLAKMPPQPQSASKTKRRT